MCSLIKSSIGDLSEIIINHSAFMSHGLDLENKDINASITSLLPAGCVMFVD